MIYQIAIETPLLPLIAHFSETYLLGLRFKETLKDPSPSYPALGKEILQQLNAYFKGKLKDFDLPYQITTGTSFQRACWEVLTQIPYGTTISYKEQAAALGDAKKARAVGGANARNPLSIVIPCHRVIGADGQLTGYSTPLGQNTHLKQALLNLEKLIF